MENAPSALRVAIACGGTGGHLFPGLAVAEQLADRSVKVTLLVSSKEIDQTALEGERRFRVVTLPAVGFSVRSSLPFAASIWRSWKSIRGVFRQEPPDVLLAMGGFTSAAPALAARSLGIPVVLHEGNAVPGRANRWLAGLATHVFVYFPEAASRFRKARTEVIGMPVRRRFQAIDPAVARTRLGLAPAGPVILVVGGSQGAQGVNDAMIRSASALVQAVPDLQVLHLAGSRDEARIRAAYQEMGIKAVVSGFLRDMEVALSAVDVVVGRAGASSIAEFAALRVPSLLIPYPHAADDHQWANARALADTGAARVLGQDEACPERLVEELMPMLTDPVRRSSLRANLARWHQPDADVRLAEHLVAMARDRSTVDSQSTRVGAPARNPTAA